MYIQPLMLEPATVSVGVYLLTKIPPSINKNHRIIRRRPLLIKQKICRWVYKNHHSLIDTIADESSDHLMDMINIINFIKLHPSIFVLLYVIALFLIIIF